MTDLELIDEYILKCRGFVSPALLGEVTSRGLYSVINFLPPDIKEARAIARARLVKRGKYLGDPEIQWFADRVDRLNFLRKDLEKINLADVDKSLILINEMKLISEEIKNYYK